MEISGGKNLFLSLQMCSLSQNSYRTLVAMENCIETVQFLMRVFVFGCVRIHTNIKKKCGSATFPRGNTRSDTGQPPIETTDKQIANSQETDFERIQIRTNIRVDLSSVCEFVSRLFGVCPYSSAEKSR